MGRAIEKSLKEKVESEFCFYCGRKMNKNNKTFDHITPVKKGGSDTVDNLVCCCNSCNQIKKDYSLYGLIEELKRQKKYCSDEVRMAYLEYYEKIFTIARQKLAVVK